MNANAITTLANADFYVSVDCGTYKATDLKLVQGVNGPFETDKTTKYFEATFAAVPVNVDCKFSGHATEHQGGAVGDVTFKADLTRKFTKGESNPQVILVLQQQDKFTTYDNQAPQILGLTISDNSVDTLKGFKFLEDPRPTFMDDTDSIIILNAKAIDPNGDPIKYKLDDGGKGGTFYKLDWDDNVIEQIFGAPGLDGHWYDVPAGGNLPAIVWIPTVGFQGKATLSLTIEDSHKGTGPLAEVDHSDTKLSVDVTVADPNDAKRIVKFFGDLNHWPDVLSIETQLGGGSNGGQVVPGQPARIWAKVHDFDRDALHYTLKSDCAGEFRSVGGSTLSFPQNVPELDCDRDAELSFDFIPAVVFGQTESSKLCTVTLTVDDYRADPNGGPGFIGGAKSGTIGLTVVKVNPVAFGPDITLAYATAGSVGAGDTVGFQINALSRNPAPTVPLEFAIELIGLDLDPISLGTFVGPKSNTTGAFSWKSPGDSSGLGVLKCFTDVGLKNFSETFFFRFTITDAAVISNGVPAVNYLVIPVEVECQK
ncbi:hypothetical protein [Anaeromyxobacter diazotrophicus]|uniref:hypothetical protein n=1 Tax=Anaeromyxobacter diazotrophicus TaxID=2590199 RepID=UPI00159284E6|nr:hypothetical protein [Anaeromyxobacter diazotrophicus]